MREIMDKQLVKKNKDKDDDAYSFLRKKTDII